MDTILPQINTEELQEKANEFAQKGAIDTIKEFYTGYNSPFKKAIEEDLQNRGVNYSFDLPDIVATLNQAISVEIDQIANQAIAKTFVPLVSKILTRAEPKMKLSDLLKKFIEIQYFDRSHHDWEDYSLEIEQSGESFLYLNISSGEKQYIQIGLSNGGNKKEPSWKFFTLPREESKVNGYSQKMTLTVEGASLEMPFIPSVLHDEFKSLIARLIIAQTEITMDVDSFHEDMFPERECHC